MARRWSFRRFANTSFTLLASSLAAACASGGFMAGGTPFASSDPDALIGLAPQQVGEALGMPELQLSEPPAEVWQYRTSSCVFNLYIYDEEEGRRAVHYTARSRSNGAVDAAHCLESIVERYRVASSEDAEEPARL